MAYNYRNVILMIDLTIRVSEAFLICEHANSFDSRISMVIDDLICEYANSFDCRISMVIDDLICEYANSFDSRIWF